MSSHQESIESEEQLIKDNYGLVVSQALYFSKPYNQDLDDYIQVGLIGLLKAIRKHDPSLSKLSTYARTCIRNEIIKFMNKNKKHKFLQSLSTDIPTRQENTWGALTDCLTVYEKDVLTMRLENYSYKDMANRFNCSANKIKNIMDKILKKITKDMN